MKPLTKDAQLTGQSHIEVVNLLSFEARSLAARGVTFFDRKPKGQHLLNALVLWFAALSDKEKAAVGAALMRRLEAFVRELPPPSVPSPGPGGSPKASPMDVADLSDLGRERQADRKHELK